MDPRLSVTVWEVSNFSFSLLALFCFRLFRYSHCVSVCVCSVMAVLHVTWYIQKKNMALI